MHVKVICSRGSCICILTSGAGSEGAEDEAFVDDDDASGAVVSFCFGYRAYGEEEKSREPKVVVGRLYDDQESLWSWDDRPSECAGGRAARAATATL